MSTSSTVQKKIKQYKPKGGLDHSARFFLALCDINHGSTKQHVENVALLAESTAKALRKDAKAAFFAGIFHDIGKLVLSSNLFDGHNVDANEYEEIKTHAQAGFKALENFHLFVALCAGLHHNLYKKGYGLTVDVFPKEWSPATVKKVLEISAIISICDFVDAFINRETKIKDGSDQGSKCLRDMLYDKYPDDHHVIDVVLKELLDKMVKEHGTLQEFSNAIWKAANDLFITDDEARAGIEKYKRQLTELDVGIQCGIPLEQKFDKKGKCLHRVRHD